MFITEFRFSKFKIFLSLLVTYFIVTNSSAPTHDQIIAISSPLATIAGILFGFVIASITFFSSNTNSTLVKSMKATKMYEKLMGNLATTGLALIIGCIFLSISIFLPSKTLPIYGVLSVNLDYGVLIFGFFFMIYGLFEFFGSWIKVNRVIPNM
ncbi:TPA: hypothetical protein P0E07_001198 [Vibrio fluvialis]|nr:hypothetical protein [Vibrio fluvialis]